MTEGRVYTNGWNAAIIHLNADANPFPAGSKAHKDWHNGWQSARDLMSIRNLRIEHAN